MATILKTTATILDFELALTKAVCVVMRVPPAAPVARRTLPASSRTRVGQVDDIGILPGTMKLVGEAGTPNTFTVPGVEKSSISLLKMMPVLLPKTFDPKLEKQT